MKTHLSDEPKKRGAFSMNGLCHAYQIGRTRIYEEIAAGRLRVRKVGRRTLILVEDAEEWAQSLPTFGAE